MYVSVFDFHSAQHSFTIKITYRNNIHLTISNKHFWKNSTLKMLPPRSHARAPLQPPKYETTFRSSWSETSACRSIKANRKWPFGPCWPRPCSCPPSYLPYVRSSKKSCRTKKSSRSVKTLLACKALEYSGWALLTSIKPYLYEITYSLCRYILY